MRNNAQSENESPNPFAAVVTDYLYYTGKNNTAQGRVDTIHTRVTYGTSMAQENNVREYRLGYGYDKNGNIDGEYEMDADGSVIDARYYYEYDEANQLIRVDDNVQKKTFTYQYDKGGNRVSEKIYPYTESDNLGTPEKTVKSLYNYIQWKDRLSSYDGKAIKYDAAGNPVSYGDQKYVWMGKQLTEIINADGTKTTFAYDADGFRTEKHQIGADGTEEYVVHYIWLNGVLTQQYLLYTMEITIKGEIRRIQVPFFVEFIYDESNQAQGCILNGDAGYLFVRNLQGDVIALADMEGRVMIEYNYDPWGKISYIYFDENGNPSNEIADESLQMITAIFCPLTYRGYNYDFTTGLYYLQARYYNPEWGRFLNCDDTSILLATQGETHGANLYAYCNNNPVNLTDFNGRHPGHRRILKLTTYSGAIGHAELRLGNIVFSYGVYAAYNNAERIKGCPATLVVAYNPYMWYQYDAKQNNNRRRTDVNVYVSESEYRSLALFYCIMVLSSSEFKDIPEKSKDPNWTLCRLSVGPYKTYRLATVNCVSVIMDALALAMPKKYHAANAMYIMAYRTPVVHPAQFSIFAKTLSDISYKM